MLCNWGCKRRQRGREVVECGGEEGEMKIREYSYMNNIIELRMNWIIEIKSIM